MFVYALQTKAEQFINITEHANEALHNSGVQNGICVVYCPHTTAGITINENADPDVRADLLLSLREQVPELAEFRHGEGNSVAHMKASMMGSSATVPVVSGRLMLGTWQGIYFCEFDGPRTRQFYVTVIDVGENTMNY